MHGYWTWQAVRGDGVISMPYDCNAGLHNWHTGWSEGKKARKEERKRKGKEGKEGFFNFLMHFSSFFVLKIVEIYICIYINKLKYMLKFMLKCLLI